MPSTSTSINALFHAHAQIEQPEPKRLHALRRARRSVAAPRVDEAILPARPATRLRLEQIVRSVVVAGNADRGRG